MPTQQQRLRPGGTKPLWGRFIALRSVRLVAAFWTIMGGLRHVDQRDALRDPPLLPILWSWNGQNQS